MPIVLVAAGGAFGSLARFLLGGFLQLKWGGGFPVGTLAVNAIGCLIVGFLSSAGGARFNLGFEARLFLVTGFCAGFTTFSSLILETDALWRSGFPGLAAGYLLSSIGAGFAAFALGSVVGRILI